MSPFTLASVLSFPPIDGQPLVPVPFNFSGQYRSREIHDLYFTSTGTFVVPMGSIASPGALVCIVEHVPITGAMPIVLLYNGSTPGKELAPGGVDLYYNPAPVAGVTSLSFTYIALGRVRVWLFGT